MKRKSNFILMHKLCFYDLYLSLHEAPSFFFGNLCTIPTLVDTSYISLDYANSAKCYTYCVSFELRGN